MNQTKEETRDRLVALVEHNEKLLQAISLRNLIYSAKIQSYYA